MTAPGSTGATRRRRARPIVSIHTTSSASGAARRRSTSRRPTASCEVRLAYSSLLSSFPLASASRSAAEHRAGTEFCIASRVDRTLPLLDRGSECLPRFGEAVDEALLDAGPAEHGREAAERIGGDLACERVGRVLGERVRFVDDHDIVVGEDTTVGREVRAVERVVHDEDRRLPRRWRELGKALGAVGAVGFARALHARAAHCGPRRVRDVVVDLAAVAGLGGLRERAQPVEMYGEAEPDRLLEERVGGAAARSLARHK